MGEDAADNLLFGEQSNMKMLCAVALIIFSVLPEGNARAEPHWVRATDSKSSETFVDTNSIHANGDIVTAWYRRNFANPMPLGASGRLYSSSRVLNYYNCATHQIATARWITYEEEDELGKVVSNEKISSPEYSEDPPDAVNKVIMGFVCNYVKSHKASNNMSFTSKVRSG